MPRLKRLRIDLDRDYAYPGAREHLSNSGAHRAEADDRHLANVHGGDITVGPAAACERPPPCWFLIRHCRMHGIGRLLYQPPRVLRS